MMILVCLDCDATDLASILAWSAFSSLRILDKKWWVEIRHLYRVISS